MVNADSVKPLKAVYYVIVGFRTSDWEL